MSVAITTDHCRPHCSEILEDIKNAKWPQNLCCTFELDREKHHRSYKYHLMSCQLLVIRVLKETRTIRLPTSLQFVGYKIITEGMSMPTNECDVRIFFLCSYGKHDMEQKKKKKKSAMRPTSNDVGLNLLTRSIFGDARSDQKLKCFLRGPNADYLTPLLSLWTTTLARILL